MATCHPAYSIYLIVIINKLLLPLGTWYTYSTEYSVEQKHQFVCANKIELNRNYFSSNRAALVMTG